MAEIKCPRCGEIIKLDKSDYDALLSNLEKDEINRRVKDQEKLIEEKYKAQYEKDLNDVKSQKNSDVVILKHQIELLEQQLQNSSRESDLAVSKAVAKEQQVTADKEKEIVNLKNELNNAKQNVDIAVAKALEEEKSKITAKQEEIIVLKTKIDNLERQTDLRIRNAVQSEKEITAKKEAEIIDLQAKINTAEQEKELAIAKAIEEQKAIANKKQE